MAVLTMNPVAENLSLKEPGTISLPWSRSITPENISGATSATRVADVYRSLSDALGISESKAIAVIWSRILSETGGFSTDYSRAMAWGRYCSDTVRFKCDRTGLSHGTLADSLGAYWNLDESSGSRIDSSGNGNTLASTNGVASTVGRNGDAATFVYASDQHLDVTDNTSLNMAGRDWSVSLWVKLDALTNAEPNDYVGICGKGDGTNDGWGMCIFYRPSLNRIELKISDGSPGTSVSGYSLRAETFGGISTGTWYFIVATFDYETMAATISVNGTEDSGTSAYVVYDPAGVGAFSIGRAFNINRYNMSGAIDGVGVWSKTLNSTEKSALYNSGAGISRPTSEDSPRTVTDYRRAVQESLALSELVRRVSDVYRSVSDTLGISAAQSLGRVFGTSVIETLGLSTYAPGFGLVLNRVLTERFGVSTAAAGEKRSPVYMSVVSNTVGASTAAAAGSVYARRVSETMRLSNSVARAVDYLRVIVDPSLGMYDDVVGWDKDHSLNVVETLGISTSSTIVGFNPGLAIIVSDSLSLSDSLTGVLTLTPVSITVADRVGASTYAYSTSLGVAWTISVNSTVGLSTGAAREVTVARLVSSNVGLSTTVVFQQDVNRVAVERLGLSTAASHADIIARLISSTLGVSTPAVSRTVAYGRAFSDTVALSESISRAVDVRRAVTETAGLSTAVERVVDAARRLSESLSLATGTPSRQTDYRRSFVDNAGFSDAKSAATVWAKSLAEHIGLADSASLGAAILRAFADTLGFSDDTDLAVTWRRAFDDDLGLSTSALQGNSLLRRSVLESLGISDELDAAAIFRRSLTDGVSLTDAVRRQVTYQRMLADALGINGTYDIFNTAGEYRSVAQGLFVPGQVAGEMFVPGESAAAIFMPGSVA